MDSVGVIDWGQVGTVAVMESEAGQPCTVGSLWSCQAKPVPGVPNHLRASGHR